MEIKKEIEEIVNKILSELPVRSCRGEMSLDEWGELFKDAVELGIEYQKRKSISKDKLVNAISDTEYKKLMNVLYS